jgi:hypothetical protein
MEVRSQKKRDGQRQTNKQTHRIRSEVLLSQWQKNYSLNLFNGKEFALNLLVVVVVVVSDMWSLLAKK